MQVKMSQKKSQMKLNTLHVTAGLVAIMVAVTVANTRHAKLESQELSSSGRKIASVSPLSPTASNELTAKLVEELRQTQSIQKNAVKPSATDRLLFETLDGQYSMTTDEGQIMALELTSDRGGVTIESETEFVKSNASALDLSEVEAVESRLEGERKLTVISGKTLSSIDQKKIYEIATDSEGRLLSLKRINQTSL